MILQEGRLNEGDASQTGGAAMPRRHIMAKRRVRCVTKDRDDDITHIGHNGQSWSRQTVAAAVKDIDDGVHQYYVDECGHETMIETVHPQNGKPYLRTVADGYSANNLDNLSSC